jgi:DNA-binding NarL/FixJ family response regulator
MSGLRVVLAEDDVLLREGLASLLERSGFEVVGQAGDSTQLLTLVHEKAPALVVVDIRMPPTHTAEGLEAARHIRQEHPETGILVLSAHVEVEYARITGDPAGPASPESRRASSRPLSPPRSISTSVTSG